MADEIALPTWKCHKIVEAAKVIDVVTNDRSSSVMLDLPAGPTRMQLPSNIFARGTPAPGDYIVRYKDGYVSWSPAAEFEDGYAPVDA